jgi:diadenosine tetraphosphate (Ap4A) HIT family hydrolase
MHRTGKRFTFDTAHHLPGLPAGHKCGTAEIILVSEKLIPLGFVTGFADLAPVGDYTDPPGITGSQRSARTEGSGRVLTASGKPAAGSCDLCAGADPGRVTALDGLVPRGRSRFVAATANLVVTPTFGCFVPGYLLIFPRAHVLSFGQLAGPVLAEAEHLIGELAARLDTVYGLPVLGFEYGLAAAGVRRVEHAHWHLLPSVAGLAGWLDERLPGRRCGSLAGLPRGGSYIAVRTQGGHLRVYDAGHDAGAARAVHQRVRLRRAVAALDPRVDGACWDWAEHRYADVIAQTAAEIAPAWEAAP